VKYRIPAASLRADAIDKHRFKEKNASNALIGSSRTMPMPCPVDRHKATVFAGVQCVVAGV